MISVLVIILCCIWWPMSEDRPGRKLALIVVMILALLAAGRENK